MRVLKSFEEFYKYAGLKQIKAKTEALIVYNDGALYEDKTLGISWIKHCFITLGTILTLNYKDIATLNINHKIKIVKDKINAWQARALQGKITVVKSLAIPQIQLLASMLLLDHKTVNEHLIVQFCLE